MHALTAFHTRPEIRHRVHRPSRAAVWIRSYGLAIGALAIALTSCSSGVQQVQVVQPTPTSAPQLSCLAQLKDETTEHSLLAAWDDALQVANATSRISLGPQIAALQKIRRDIDAEPWPVCAAHFKQTTLNAMDTTIHGYLTFMTDTYGVHTATEAQTEKAAWDTWSRELASLDPTPAPVPAPPTPVPPATAVPAGPLPPRLPGDQT